MAGQPTVTPATTGTGTYNGTAIGSVINNGQGYIAAGNFATSYNFGNNTGTIGISNFDGRAVNGTVFGASGIYVGALSGTNLSARRKAASLGRTRLKPAEILRCGRPPGHLTRRRAFSTAADPPAVAVSA